MSPVRKPVDHRKIADLIARHGGNHYEVAGRFAAHFGLSKLDKLRIAKMAKQQKAIQEAIERAAKADPTRKRQ